MNYRIAAYLRLSWADEDMDQSEKSESNSITNQRNLIRHYLKTHQEFKEGVHADYEYLEYVDDGISGTTVEHRPSFLRLIDDAKSRKFDCIIVKDFSRFSRQALVLGDYVEQIFPMISIRFISVNDHYDSSCSAMSGSTSALTVSMKALVNEYYVKDNVRKRTAAIQARMANGRPMGTAPYGYRHIDTRNYEIDPITSEVVRRIYHLALEGKSVTQIGLILTEEGCPTPNDYNTSHPEEKHSRRPAAKVSRWSVDTIRYILHNPVYTGTLTTGRSKYAVGHKKKRIPTALEEQYVTVDAHPAIISKDEFEAVQEMFAKRNKRSKVSCAVDKASDIPKAVSGTSDNATSNKGKFGTDMVRTIKAVPLSLRDPRQAVLKGHLRCGYCGRILSIYSGGSSSKCPNSYQHVQNTCPGTGYRIKPIQDMLFNQIKELAEKIIVAERECQERYRAGRKRIIDLKSKQGLLEKERLDLINKKQHYYEGLIDGEYSLAQYQMHSQSLQSQSQNLQQALENVKNEIHILQDYQVPIELQLLAKQSILFSCHSELSGEMVDEYVKEVILKGNETPTIIWNHLNLLQEYHLI